MITQAKRDLVVVTIMLGKGFDLVGCHRNASGVSPKCTEMHRKEKSDEELHKGGTAV
jgi:hypothetical protein